MELHERKYEAIVKISKRKPHQEKKYRSIQFPIRVGSSSISPDAIGQDTTGDDDHNFGDYIAKYTNSDILSIPTLVFSVFHSLKVADPNIPPFKVLAGVVMSNGITINGCQVISIATWNDCINGCYLYTKGEAVNDSHAVVLARRGLVSFLYDQLEKYGTHPEESVFLFV